MVLRSVVARGHVGFIPWFARLLDVWISRVSRRTFWCTALLPLRIRRHGASEGYTDGLLVEFLAIELI